MLGFLSRLFNVRPDEWRLVLMLQAQLFLIILVLLIAKPIAVAQFIGVFGAKSLASIFVATALLAALLSRFFAKFRRTFGPLKLNLSALGGSFLSLMMLLLLRLIPGFEPMVATGLYLWMAIYGLLAASQFWMLANYTLDIEQAKRLFGFIGAGGIVGAILGGYLTSWLSGPMGTNLLLWSAGLLLLPAMKITIMVWKRYIPDIIQPTDEEMAAAKTHLDESELAKKSSAWQAVTSSKPLRLICALILLGVIVSKLVDYQFSAIGALQYPDPEELAAFFGFWLSTFSLIAIVLQLLLTTWMIKWFGVSGTLLMLPLGICFAALMMLFMPGLPAAVLGRGADGSLKQSLNRAATELLYIPLSSDLKERVKTYIDVFIDSLASGVAGVMLIVLVDFLQLGATQISWAVLILVAVWVACVVLVKEVYSGAFKEQVA